MLARSQEAIVALITVSLIVLFSFTVPGFLSGGNFMKLLQSGVTLGLLGIGVGIIVISRGIDLSVVAVMAVPSALVLDLVTRGQNITAAILAGLSLAAGIGLINGILIALVELPPLFVTLATGLGLYGAAIGIWGYDILIWPERLNGLAWIGRSSLFGVPTPLLILAALLIIASGLLSRTRVGRLLYAIGDNPRSAWAIGAPTKRIIFLLYVLSALLAFLTGMLISALLGAATIRVFNSTLMYDVILVIVLGGIGLSGGRGSMLSVLLGTLLIATISNAMILLNAPYAAQNFFKGAMLLAAIILDSRLNPRNEETAQQGDI